MCVMPATLNGTAAPSSPSHPRLASTVSGGGKSPELLEAPPPPAVPPLDEEAPPPPGLPEDPAALSRRSWPVEEAAQTSVTGSLTEPRSIATLGRVTTPPATDPSHALSGTASCSAARTSTAFRRILRASCATRYPTAVCARWVRPTRRTAAVWALHVLPPVRGRTRSHLNPRVRTRFQRDVRSTQRESSPASTDRRGRRVRSARLRRCGKHGCES